MTKMDQMKMVMKNAEYAQDIGDFDVMRGHWTFIADMLTSQRLILGGTTKECTITGSERTGFRINTTVMRAGFDGIPSWQDRTYCKDSIQATVAFVINNGYDLDQGE